MKNIFAVQFKKQALMLMLSIVQFGFLGIATAVVVTPVVDEPITANRKRAALIYQRLTSVKLPIDAPELIQMEDLLNRGLNLEAADIATNNTNFLDITVRHMAARMSTREETYKAPLSDFVASFIGVTRDNTSAKELLTGDFYYAADPALAPNIENTSLVDDIISSNDHYNELQAEYSPAAVLVRRNGQQIRDSAGAAVANPDPAGVLTSRAFSEAHAVAGTNRRIVEFSFKQFLCQDIEQWADTSQPDNRVGPDVDRAPGGEPAKYQTTCKGCHSGMDGLRGAFARVDFANDFIKHGNVMTNRERPNDDRANEFNGTAGISWKYRRNNNIFPLGYNTVDNSWVNHLVAGSNASFFGWRSPASGAGVNSYGRLLAESQAFSKCMVKRVYRQVCKRNVSKFENQYVQDTAATFEANNYNLKQLFQSVATSDACIGK